MKKFIQNIIAGAISGTTGFPACRATKTTTGWKACRTTTATTTGWKACRTLTLNFYATAVAAFYLLASAAFAGEWKDYCTTAWPNNGNVDGDVYTVNTAGELAQFAATVNGGNNYNGKTVVLAQNIDLSAGGHTWNPAGTVFRGTFDGNHNTIHGMKITGTFANQKENLGLFRQLASGAVVKNIRFTGVNIDCTQNGTGVQALTTVIRAGAVAGEVGSILIDNVSVDEASLIYVRNTKPTYNAMAGGIVADHVGNGIIRNCVNYATIKAESTGSGGKVFVGGIAGVVLDSRIANSLNGGALAGKVDHALGVLEVGGIVGRVDRSDNIVPAIWIENCLNTGVPSALPGNTTNNPRLGSLIGESAYPQLSIANAYWTTAAPALGTGNVGSDKTMIKVLGPAPGKLSAAHPDYGTDDLLVVLNGWGAMENEINPGKFHGWGVEAPKNGGFPILGDWYVPTAEFEVVLDHNDGTGDMQVITVVYNEPMPEEGVFAPAARAGYTFAGFADAEGEMFYDAQMNSVADWNVMADGVLFAQWKANDYVMFLNHHNGGTVQMMGVVFGKALPASPAPERTGYKFAGYFDGRGEEAVMWYDADMVGQKVWDIAGNATFHARWTAKVYNVDLDFNNGSGTVETLPATYNEFLPAAAETGFGVPAYYGHEFMGFEDAAGLLYYDAQMTPVRKWRTAGDGALGAKWKAKTYNIPLDYNNGSGRIENVTATFDEFLPAGGADGIIPTYKGHIFKGFMCTIGYYFYDEEMNPILKWFNDGGVVLYAQWERDENDFVVPDICHEQLGGVMITAIDVYTPAPGESCVPHEIVTLTWRKLEDAQKYLIYAKGALTDPKWDGYVAEDYEEVGADELRQDVILHDGVHTNYHFYTMRAWTNKVDAGSGGGDGGAGEYPPNYIVMPETDEGPVAVKPGDVIVLHPYGPGDEYEVPSHGGGVYYPDQGGIVTDEDDLFIPVPFMQVTAQFDMHDVMGQNIIGEKAVWVGFAYGDLPVVSRVGHRFNGWFVPPHKDHHLPVIHETYVRKAQNHVLLACWTAIPAEFTGIGTNKVVDLSIFSKRVDKEMIVYMPEATAGDAKITYTKIHNGSDQAYAAFELDSAGRPRFRFPDRSVFDGMKENGFHSLYVRAEADNNTAPVTVLMKFYVVIDFDRNTAITVSFDAQGGDVFPASKELCAGRAYWYLPIPVKEGCKFAGWSLEPDGTVLDPEKEMPLNKTDHTLYALWK